MTSENLHTESDDVGRNILFLESETTIVALTMGNGMWGEPMWGGTNTLGAAESHTYISGARFIEPVGVSLNLVRL